MLEHSVLDKCETNKSSQNCSPAARASISRVPAADSENGEMLMAQLQRTVHLSEGKQIHFVNGLLCRDKTEK